MNLKHFIERAISSDDLPGNKLSESQFRKLLTDRINAVDIDKVKGDAMRFIPDPARLDIWSKKYFYDLSSKLKVG